MKFFRQDTIEINNLIINNVLIGFKDEEVTKKDEKEGYKITVNTATSGIFRYNLSEEDFVNDNFIKICQNEWEDTNNNKYIDISSNIHHVIILKREDEMTDEEWDIVEHNIIDF